MLVLVAQPCCSLLRLGRHSIHCKQRRLGVACVAIGDAGARAVAVRFYLEQRLVGRVTPGAHKAAVSTRDSSLVDRRRDTVYGRGGRYGRHDGRRHGHGRRFALV